MPKSHAQKKQERWRELRRLLLLSFVLVAPSRAEAISFDCVLPDPVVAYRFVPNCSGQGLKAGDQIYHFSTNAQGLKTRDYPATARPGHVRVLLIGDSFTTDIENRGFGAELHSALEKRGRIELINGSMPGYTLVQQRLLLPRLLQAYRPQVVLVNSMFSTWWLTAMQQHELATVKGPDGLATELGIVKVFWPLSNSWNDLVWRTASKFGDPHHLRVVAQSAQLLLTKLRLWWRGLGRESGSVVREVQETHLAYLRAMRAEAKLAGAEFVMLNIVDRPIPVARSRPRTHPFLWYQAQQYAEALPPRVLPPEAISGYLSALKREFPVVDISDIDREQEPLSPSGVMYDVLRREPLARVAAERLVPLLPTAKKKTSP